MKNLGLKKLDSKECSKINGGVPWFVPTTVALGIYLYDNRERFIEGVKKVW